MRPELLRFADALAGRGESFAIATVVSRRAPSSARIGDTAIVTRDGGFHGWIGGSCTRPTVVAEALKALADGEPRLIALSPDPQAEPRHGLSVFPMTCRSGGTVEVHIQPVLAPARLFVFGLTPIARAVVRLGAAMGLAPEGVDPEADAEAFPGARRVHTDAAALERPAARSGEAARVYAVVATQGEWDEEALLAAVALRPDYLGLVASPKRSAELREMLERRVPDAERPYLEVLEGPAGLDIGAREPEEIAVSILAEIVERKARGVRVATPEARVEPAADAVDPVCGMTVSRATARHRAEHAGHEYLFCCAGCREKFLASPECWASAER